MPGKPAGAVVTLSVRWDGSPSRPPREDDVFATRNRHGDLSSIYHAQEVAGGPIHYRITAVKLDPRSWEGDLDWEMVWNSRD